MQSSPLCLASCHITFPSSQCLLPQHLALSEILKSVSPSTSVPHITSMSAEVLLYTGKCLCLTIRWPLGPRSIFTADMIRQPRAKVNTIVTSFALQQSAVLAPSTPIVLAVDNQDKLWLWVCCTFLVYHCGRTDDTTGTASIAGATLAAAAYIDGKLQLRKDLLDLWQVKRAQREWNQAGNPARQPF